MTISKYLITAAAKLRDAVDRLTFSPPVTHVYNPLEYAGESHQLYLTKYGGSAKKVVMLGMNPGPWGMAQVGVPFGEVSAVRDWMKIETKVGKPGNEHPKRPIEGFACQRSEVSGRRLWGLMAERFGTADCFFEDHFVTNYCPLVFMEEGGRNRTPDKLPAAEKKALEEACDAHLRTVIALLEPEWCIGVGGFATKCLEKVIGASDAHPRPRIGTVLHPSPASPAANRGWAEAATKQLEDLGVWT